MQRVVVASGPGAGKTRFAQRLGLPCVELDSLWWDPGWRQPPIEKFQSRVRSAVDHDSWVIEGFYVDEAGVPIIWPRADTLVWLDFPRRVCVAQAVRRSFLQVIRRVELWNGNYQRPSVLTPRSIWRLWRRWPAYPATIERALAEHDWSHLNIVRLRDRQAVDRFLANHAKERRSTS